MARKKKFAPNDNNLAIAYYRFSSHSQNDASMDQQRELAHDWADAHGFKIVQEYEDAAISGTTDARPGFQQMLSEVAKSVLIPSSCGRPTVWDATNTFWRWRRRKSATRDARFTCWPSTSRRRDPKASSSRD